MLAMYCYEGVKEDVSSIRPHETLSVRLKDMLILPAGREEHTVAGSNGKVLTEF